MSTLQEQNHSPDRTVVDLNSGQRSKWTKAEEAPTAGLADDTANDDGPRGAEIKLSQGRKWFLLGIFSVAQVSCPNHFAPSALM